MKRPCLLWLAGILLGGAVSADGPDDGAIGIGIISPGTGNSYVSLNLKASLFIDVGGAVAGPLHAGLELAGDLSRLDQTSGLITQADVTGHSLGGSEWTEFSPGPTAQETYVFWTGDISPRAYLSLDAGPDFQLLGFAGPNLCWEHLDFTVKNAGETAWATPDGSKLAPGQSSFSGHDLGPEIQAVAGARLTFTFLYLEYSRYFNLSGAVLAADNTNLSRFGTGVNFRF